MKKILAHLGGKPVFAGFLLLVECALWGLGNPLTKIAYAGVAPFHMLAIRFTLAAALFFCFFGGRVIRGLKKAKLGDVAIISVFTAMAYICCNLSLLYAEATIAGFLMSLAVVFTPIFSLLLLREAMDRRYLPIILLIVSGMYLLCGGTFRLGPGEILALLCSLCSGVMLVISSRSLRVTDAMVISASQCVVAALACWLCAAIFEPDYQLAAISTEAWWIIIYLVVACTCLAYSLQNYALGRLNPVYSSLALCTEPLFTAVGSGWLLGERLSLMGMAGAGAILVGVCLASIFIHSSPVPAPAKAPRIAHSKAKA